MSYCNRLRIPGLSLALTLALVFANMSELVSAPSGLTEKEAKKFEKSVKRYYKKCAVEKDGNDSSLVWVQAPLEKNKGESDTFYYLRAGLKNGSTVVAQVVVKKDYVTTQNIYDPNAFGWNSAMLGQGKLRIDSSVVTERDFGVTAQYGFVQVTIDMLRKFKDSGFTIAVKHTVEGDDTNFEIAPAFITGFLSKYDEAKDD